MKLTVMRYRGDKAPESASPKLLMSLFLPTGCRALEMPDKKEMLMKRVSSKILAPLAVTHWVFEWK